MTQSRKLKLALTLALVPALGGLGIFFTWWIGKAWFLTTWQNLELIGVLWMLPSCLMAFIGLGVCLSYTLDAEGWPVLKGIAVAVCILINIPVVMWVLDKQADIEKRAYVRLYNETGKTIDSLFISNSLFVGKLNNMKAGESRTLYVYPNYDEWDSSIPSIEPIELLVVTGTKKSIRLMPVLYKGSGTSFAIDSKYKISEHSK